MELKTGSVYDLSKHPHQDREPIRILVMRHWPRGISNDLVDLWVKSAAPSAALLKQYRDKQIDWYAFAEAYCTEQAQAKIGPIQYYTSDARNHRLPQDMDMTPVEWIRGFAMATDRPVLLLCWERSGNCHRQLLKKLIESDPQ